MSWDVVFGYVTGLRIIDPSMTAGTLLSTALAVHTADAIMCRLFAHNNGYPKNLCTVLGFLFGIWALAVLIVLPSRKTRPAGRPASAHAPPLESARVIRVEGRR